MTTTLLPAFKYPGDTTPAVDNGRKFTNDWGRWSLGIDRAVRKLLAGVNNTDTNAAQAEADAQTAITNAAAAQATANAALPKAGGTMTGALILSGATASLTVASMTTTQKNALTAVNGMIVYDTTLAKFQGYEAGAWVNLV